MSVLRVVFCGDSDVGKTAMINRFSRNEFDSTLQPTVAANIHKELILNNNQSINLEIWDTAGDERYNSIIPLFFKKADAIIIVYDISNKQSFEHLKFWIDTTIDNAPKDSCFIIAGNKCDKVDNREVTKDEGTNYSTDAKAFGFIETSALTGEGIMELFSLAASSKSKNNNDSDDYNNYLQSNTDKKKCC